MSEGIAAWVRVIIAAILLFVLGNMLIFLVDISDRFFLRSATKKGPAHAHTAIKIFCAIFPAIAILLGTALGFSTKIDRNFFLFYSLIRAYSERYPDDPDLEVFPPEIFDFRSLDPAFPQIIFALIVFLMCIYFLSPIPRRSVGYIYRHRYDFHAPFYRSKFYLTASVLTVFFTILFLLPNLPMLPDFVVEIPRILGTLSLALLFLLFLSIHTAALTELGEKYGYPVLSVVVISAILFSYHDWNDNHIIRNQLLVPKVCREVNEGRACSPPPILPLLDDAFVDWINDRPAEVKARFSKSSYPVYVVAAEGGGIYAAAQTALFLAKLYDRCPALSHHVFAISGVSGGSLGAALVAALINAKSQELGENSKAFFASCSGKAPAAGSGSFEELALEYLSQDFLSPSVAAGLFPDFLQRFLPWPIEMLDRARAFERALEQSWRKLHRYQRDDFAEKFRPTWDPAGNAPMLLLNTTVAERGIQAVIGPFENPYRFSNTEARFYLHPFFGEDGLVSTRFDIPLSTAVGLSARFTAIAPPGYHFDTEDFQTRSDRFVDGGYVENSGVETANSVLAILSNAKVGGSLINIDRPTLPLPPGFQFDPQLVVISSTSEGLSVFGEVNSRPIKLNEIGSPIAALYNSRVERAATAVARAESHASTLRPGIPFAFFKPPLGWHISRFTLAGLRAYIGTAERCIGKSFPDPFSPFTRFDNRVNEVGGVGITETLVLRERLLQNHCSACSMIRAAQAQPSQLISGISCYED
jgi:hypothetical protein